MAKKSPSHEERILHGAFEADLAADDTLLLCSTIRLLQPLSAYSALMRFRLCRTILRLIGRNVAAQACWLLIALPLLDRQLTCYYTRRRF